MEIVLTEFGVKIRLIVEPDPDQAKPANGDPIQLDLEVTPEAQDPEVPDPVATTGLTSAEKNSLEAKLRKWRRTESERRSVPTYIILTDRSVMALVEHPPHTREELQMTKGIGLKVIELYGEQILSITSEIGEDEPEDGVYLSRKDRLVQWRAEEALRRKVAIHVVLRDDSITDLCDKRPQFQDQLIELRGIGPKTVEAYGSKLLELVGPDRLTLS